MGSLNIISRSDEAFADRQQAAQLLGEHLGDYAKITPVVAGIPRGGVVIAEGLAGMLGGQLDIVLTRKLGAPSNPELAIGSVAENGKVFLNQRVVSLTGASEDYIQQEKENELARIEQRAKNYRQVLEKTPLEGKTVILTDDGVATGSTMQASVWSVRAESPEKIIVSLPVAPEDSLEMLAKDADEVICLRCPAYFSAISQFYKKFEQVNDEQIIQMFRDYRGRSQQ